MAKVKNKRNSGLADKVHKKRKAEGQQKKLNPFEVHINKEKIKVLGQKSKHDRGLPGVSRAKAIKKRKETLGTELKLMHKTNAFIDKRIGEKDAALSGEERILARFAAERARRHTHNHVYNLADDEVLTHRGQTLEQIEKFDDPRSSDEEDDDGRKFGGLDNEFVSEGHFGGGVLSRVESRDGAKSHKDLIDQLIADSKKRKADKQKEKEQTLDLTERLDSEWKDLQPVVLKKARVEEHSAIERVLSKAERHGVDYDKMMQELRFEKRGTPSDGLQSEEKKQKEEKQKLEQLERDRELRMYAEEEDGTRIVPAATKHRSAEDLDDNLELEEATPELMLAYDRDGNPLLPQHVLNDRHVPNSKNQFDDGISDSSSDEEESDDDDDDEDNKVESDDDDDAADNVKEDDDAGDDSSEEENEVTEETSKNTIKNKLDSVTDELVKKCTTSLDRDNTQKEETTSETLSTNTTLDNTNETKHDHKDTKQNNIKSKTKLNSVKENSSVNVNDIQTSDKTNIEDNESSDGDEEGSDDDASGSVNEKVEFANLDDLMESEHSSGSEGEAEQTDEESKQSAEAPGEDTAQDEDKIKSFFDQSTELDNLKELLADKSPSQQSSAVEKLIASYAPGLAESNKELLSHVFAGLLRHISDMFTGLTAHRDVITAFQVLDQLSPHLYQLATTNKVSSKKYLAQLLKQKHDQFKKNTKRVPDLDTLVFFKLVSLIYPTSDFRHPVTTPAFVFMSEILTLCRFRDAYSISRGLFITALVLEYVVLSKRLVPAAINYLRGLLYLTANTTVLNPVQVVPPFKLHKDSKILNLEDDCSKMAIEEKMTAKDLVVNTIDNDFKIRCLSTVVSMLKEFFDNLNDLEAQECLFEPHIKLLGRVDTDLYPKCIAVRLTSTLQYMRQSLEVKTYSPLVKEKLRPKALRLYEPDVQQVFTGSKSSHLSREQAELSKLKYKLKRERAGARRELRRDAAYLATTRLRDKITGDKIRKEKVKQIYKEAAIQQGELNQFKRKKK